MVGKTGVVWVLIGKINFLKKGGSFNHLYNEYYSVTHTLSIIYLRFVQKIRKLYFCKQFIIPGSKLFFPKPGNRLTGCG